MHSREAKAVLDEIEAHCAHLCQIAKVARRNQKSLTGTNPYGIRFHSVEVALTRAASKVTPILAVAGLDGAANARLSGLLDVIRSPSSTPRQRNDALRELRMTCHATVVPALESMTASPVPHTEQVLPLDVVRGTRPYIEKVVVQANGCYEHQWFDASSVMVRRLVETLIIEVYEHQAKRTDIEDGKGGYLMLNGLITVLLAETSWKLSREAPDALREIKSLGDRSAHNRRFTARRADIDKVKSGLRVLVDDLVHLAGFR
jgi:hypothetical protein